MTLATVRLDLGKNWIHVVGLDGDGRISLHRRVKRAACLALTANMPACLIGMEACDGADGAPDWVGIGGVGGTHHG